MPVGEHRLHHVVIGRACLDRGVGIGVPGNNDRRVINSDRRSPVDLVSLRTGNTVPFQRIAAEFSRDIHGDLRQRQRGGRRHGQPEGDARRHGLPVLGNGHAYALPSDDGPSFRRFRLHLRGPAGVKCDAVDGHDSSVTRQVIHRHFRRRMLYGDRGFGVYGIKLFRNLGVAVVQSLNDPDLHRIFARLRVLSDTENGGKVKSPGLLPRPDNPGKYAFPAGDAHLFQGFGIVRQFDSQKRYITDIRGHAEKDLHRLPGHFSRTGEGCQRQQQAQDRQKDLFHVLSSFFDLRKSAETRAALTCSPAAA